MALEKISMDIKYDYRSCNRPDYKRSGTVSCCVNPENCTISAKGFVSMAPPTVNNSKPFETMIKGYSNRG